MRLTNNTLLRGYNRSLNRLKTAKNDCENKITSQRKFARASDAPLSAAKALNVRKSIYYSEQHKENLKVASSFYTEAETSLLQVSEKMAEVREALIAAVNTTKDDTEYNIYAQQLETMARELCSIFNTDSAGRSIFGGESDDAMPFTIINDSNGFASTVLYHGVPVNSLDNCNDFPYSNRVYVDIGLGMRTDQESHVTDPMSVLDISFNGTEITGCGAERSTADIDLSAIKEGRLYLFDIYCDGSKKTITFKGKGTPGENVAQINDLLRQAYKKDIAYGKSYPKMDDQGIVYSVYKDADGNEEATEGGLVSITNNTYINKIDRWNVDAGFNELNGPDGKWDAVFNARTDALVIDNDSGFTNKFKLNFDALAENALYKVDVKVGDETKSIEFVSGNNEGEEFAEVITIKNFQEALDAAFGVGVVTVSTHEPVKGVVSAEGKQVELMIAISQEDADKANGVYDETYSKAGLSITNGDSKISFGALQFKDKDDSERTYKFDVDGYTVGGKVQQLEVTIKSGDSNNTILKKINDALQEGDNKKLVCGNDGIITDDGTAVSIKAGTGTSSSAVSKVKTYQVDPDSIENGKTYKLKVVHGNSIDEIEFEGTGNGLQDLKAAFGAGYDIDAQGVVTAKDGKSVLISNDTDLLTRAAVERDKIYSNNYVQLTLDAARALRNGDIEYANGCIDKIVKANEHLLLEIADLGCNEDFIDFNIERITTREYNLYERQDDLEASDPEYMITLLKQYEAYYNACLQMSTMVIPNSIFNYMR